MKRPNACGFYYDFAVTAFTAVAAAAFGQNDEYKTGQGQSSKAAQILSTRTARQESISRQPQCRPWLISKHPSFSQNLALPTPNSSHALAATNFISPLTSFATLSDPNWLVPDPSIAVGQNHVLAAVNSKLAFYTKSGDTLFATTLEAWFEPILPLSDYDCGPYQPQFLYDHFDDRWIMTALATDTGRGKSFLLLAVSAAGDSIENWYAWALDMSKNGSIDSGLQAYDLKLGLGANTIFLSTNQFAGTQFQYAKIRMLPLSDVLSGSILHWWDVWDLRNRRQLRPAFSVVPALCFDQVTSVFGVETGADKDSVLTRWEMIPDFPAKPFLESDTIHIHPYTSTDSTSQPTPAPPLNISDARVQAAIFRNGKLWVTFSTKGFGITARCSQIHVVGYDIGGGFKTFDEARTIDVLSHFMPGLAVDGLDNLGLFYYSSSQDSFPSFEALTHDATKPDDAFPEARAVIRKSRQSLISQQEGQTFWGSHVGMALDPSDEKTFWGVGEVVSDQSAQQWLAWIGATALPKFQPNLQIDGDATQTLVVRGVEQNKFLTISNLGEVFVGKTSLGAYFSTDASWSRANDTLLSETSFPALNAGALESFSFKYTIASNISSKQGYVLFVIDHHEQIPEPNENDNILIQPAIIVDPLVCDLDLQQPREAQQLCAEKIRIEAVPMIKGGQGPYTLLECSLNNVPASVCSDTLIVHEFQLSPGENRFTARLIVRDALGLRDTCETSIRAQKALPLTITAEILTPKPRAFFCDNEITVTGAAKISGGAAPRNDSCWVNGTLVDIVSDTFMLTMNLPSGRSNLTLFCSTRDSCGSFARAADTVSVVIEGIAPLQPELKLIQPSANAKVCGDQMDLVLLADFSGGAPPVKRSCLINDSTIVVASDTIRHLLKLNAGKNIFEVICTFSDSCGRSISDTVSLEIIADPTPPLVKWSYAPFYPYIKGYLRDSETGIASIQASVLVNARLSYDSFSPGQDSVAFRIDPIDATRPIGFLFSATNVAGCVTVVDPLIVRLSGDQNGNLVNLNVPSYDHFFNIENHGLAQITLRAAGKEYRFIASSERTGREGDTFYVPVEGGFTLDIKELWSEDELAVMLIGSGQSEQYAYIIFSDRPWNFTTALEEQPRESAMPEHYALHPCYPNPFNPATNIRFEIPRGKAEAVSLKIYNLQGQLMTTLADGPAPSGVHELSWHGVDHRGAQVSSGAYFCVLRAKGFHAVRKMLLAR
jgi:hypothetical protein